MRYIRLSLICLLILAISTACISALAEEEEEIKPVESYYTPGKYCVVYDGSWGTITLNGEQPARTYSDGYDLGFKIINCENKSIVVNLFGFTLNDEIYSHQNIEVQVPANSTVDCAIPILPDFLAHDALQYDVRFDPEDIDRIRSFDGIDTFEFVMDSRYVDPDNYTYLSISYPGLIHLH